MKRIAGLLLNAFLCAGGGWADEVEIDTAVVQDVRSGQLVSADIHPGVPPRTFLLIADKEANVIHRIEVYVPDQKTPVQTLEAVQGDPPYRDAKYFKVVDIDFDGYQDIGLLSWWGVTGNEGWRFWRFDPKSGKFVHDRVVSELPRPEFDPKTKTIRTFTKASACESTTITYAYKKGKLDFQKGERCNLTEQDPPQCKCHPLELLSN